MSATLSQIPHDAHLNRHYKRQQVEQLLALADYLPETDRVLIVHLLGKGTSIQQLAKLAQRPPRKLHRQAKSILKRMSSSLFRFIALHLNTLPSETRTTARYVVLHGKSLRETARATDLTLHQVRQHMSTVHAAARLLN